MNIVCSCLFKFYFPFNRQDNRIIARFRSLWSIWNENKLTSVRYVRNKGAQQLRLKNTRIFKIIRVLCTCIIRTNIPCKYHYRRSISTRSSEQPPTLTSTSPLFEDKSPPKCIGWAPNFGGRQGACDIISANIIRCLFIEQLLNPICDQIV